ncbi:hypothetical protein [Lentibacillus sp. Marseille-P4043]|uniref:hypothetical protein n=1 Tax=Lentibacillus sp. Marseille-P4043 TaxID=2040293 RepID=UPI000D0B3547|nr:hypothetical protein [Lentibacillus sp. Marseille-P4043]
MKNPLLKQKYQEGYEEGYEHGYIVSSDFRDDILIESFAEFIDRLRFKHGIGEKTVKKIKSEFNREFGEESK